MKPNTEESCDYLLVHCPLAREVWYSGVRALGKVSITNTGRRHQELVDTAWFASSAPAPAVRERKARAGLNSLFAFVAHLWSVERVQ